MVVEEGKFFRTKCLVVITFERDGLKFLNYKISFTPEFK